MTVLASCGHDLTGEMIAETIVTVKAVTREAEHAISVRTACKKCREEYELAGLMLHGPEEEIHWLHGKVNLCQPVI